MSQVADLHLVEYGHSIPFNEETRPVVEAFLAVVRQAQETRLRKLRRAAASLFSETAP